MSNRAVRWIAASLVVASLTSACTGSGDSEGESSEKATVVVWYWGTPDDKVMRQIDADYMAAHPNVTIKRVVQPGTTFPTLMQSTVAARKGPDLFAMYASPFVFDYTAGVEGIEKYITDKDKAEVIGYSQTTTKAGKAHGVPFDANGNMMYYDKAKFDKAGISGPPETWDDMLQACDKLNAAGITPIQAGWKDGGYLEWWLSLLAVQYQTDAETEKAVTDPDWKSPSLQKGLDRVRELRDRDCFTPDAESIPLFPDTVNSFKAGKAAMMVGLSAGDIHWKQFRETKWGKDGLGAFLLPLVPGSEWDAPRVNYTAGTVWAVTKWSKHKEAAVDFAKYMASAEVQTKYFGGMGAFPANLKATPEMGDDVGDQILGYTKTNDPYGGQFSLIRGVVEAEVLKFAAALVSGDKDWKDIEDSLQEKQDRGAE